MSAGLVNVRWVSWLTVRVRKPREARSVAIEAVSHAIHRNEVCDDGRVSTPPLPSQAGCGASGSLSDDEATGAVRCDARRLLGDLRPSDR